MEGESNTPHFAPPIFDGDNYHTWAVKMEAYLEALDLWEVVEEELELGELPNNPTVAQMKSYKEKKTRKSKAKASLFAAVSSSVFTRIMSLKSAYAIWEFLKIEFSGSAKTKRIQVLNLIREFEMQKMKESETIKGYSDKLLSIANKIRLLGSDFPDTRLVEKILVTILERYEACLTSLENSSDILTITLSEIVHALQAQDQRRSMREEGEVEGALLVKVLKGKKMNVKCSICGKYSHDESKCWYKGKPRCSNCNRFGHSTKNCRTKEAANLVEEVEEEGYVP